MKDTNPNVYQEFSFPISGFNRDRTITGAKEFYGLENGVTTYLSIYASLTPTRENML